MALCVQWPWASIVLCGEGRSLQLAPAAGPWVFLAASVPHFLPFKSVPMSCVTPQYPFNKLLFCSN